MPDAVFGTGSVTAQLISFSHLQVVQTVPTLQRDGPIRRWFFTIDPAKDSPETLQGPRNTQGKLVDLGGVLHEKLGPGNPIFNFGDGNNGSDRHALEAFSSADGVTFWVRAEDVGSVVLNQHQKFEALVDRPTLRFVVTAGLLEGIDNNNAVSLAECPRGTEVAVCTPLNAHIRYEAQATTMLGELLADANGVPVLDTEGYARLAGRQGGWQDLAVEKLGNRTTAAWQRSDFLFSNDVGGSGGQDHARAKLTRNLVFNLDLSNVRKGTEFRVTSFLTAFADNQRRRESGLRAYVRDPANSDGIQVEFTGLRLVKEVQEPPPPKPRTAPPCTNGPDPAAGVLQFNQPAYSLLEQVSAGLSSEGVMVTRSQGSKGAVSVNVTASGGTATAGVHYKPLVKTVHFADGDTDRRLVEVELLQNATTEADKTVNLTLSAPGGCASLGAASSAVLTILDDDQLPPARNSGLDPTFGTLGEAVFDRFGGNRSSMALQADGKIVMAGGTLQDFILARFNADGSIDRSFGVDGKVTTDMGSGFITEEATAVAVQADGKIVVVGYTAVDNKPPNPDGPPTFALARYHTDGSLDTSFGRQGRVSGNVNGRARAVAIQPDGRIVAAGEFSFDSTNGIDFSDFTVARFKTDGNLDATFGADATGQIARDLGGSNSAQNIVLQPDGKIVVSGKPSGDQVGFDHTDVARFNADGSFDTSFGTGGKLKLPGLLVGEGMARQADGKLVLVGSVVQAVAPGSARFVLQRLNANGTPDASFGTGGKVDTAFTQNARAQGVALQADGKIVVVGTGAFVAVSDFIVARYHPNGTLDASFGTAGTLALDFFHAGSLGENVLVQPDGKILVSGAADNASGAKGYGVARILP